MYFRELYIARLYIVVDNPDLVLRDSIVVWHSRKLGYARLTVLGLT